VGLTECARTIIARYLAGDSESLYVVRGMLEYKRPSDVAEELSVSKTWVRSVYLHYGACYRYRSVLLKLFDFLERSRTEPVIMGSVCRLCGKTLSGGRQPTIDHIHKKHRDLVQEVLRAWAREVVQAWR